MSKIKRIAPLAIVLIMALAFFAACGGNDETEIVFAWWGGDGRYAQTTEVVELFLAQSDDVDYVERVVAAWADYWGMMGARAAAGDMPDVFQQDVSRLVEYFESNLKIDLAPYIRDGSINTDYIPQAVIDAGRVNGVVVGIPTGMNVTAMVYNKGLLDSLGLEAPRNITLDQFIDLARAVYAQGGVRTNWAYNDPANQMEVHLRAQGVNLFEGNALGGTADNYVEFFQVVRQGIDEGWHLRPEHMAGRAGAEQNPMWYPPGDGDANLRVWNSPVWSNMVTGYVNDAPHGMVLNMTTYPSHNPQVSNFGRAAMFLSVSTHSENPDAAVSLIDFFMNSVEAHQIMLGDRGVIVNSRVADAVYPVLPPAAQMQTEFVAWTNNGNSTPFNPTRPEGAGEVIELLNDITERVTFGELSPREAADLFFAQGNAILG